MTAQRSQAAWDALRRGRDALAAQVESVDALMAELLDQLGERENLSGDAPGHSHDVPGVWDSDNGEIAGKKCAWCATWNHAKSIRSSGIISADILRARDARVNAELLYALAAGQDAFDGGTGLLPFQMRKIADEMEQAK